MDIKYITRKSVSRLSSIFKEFIQISTQYSIKYACLSLLDWVSFYLHMPSVRGYVIRQKINYLNTYIHANFPEIIKKYIHASESIEPCKEFNVWIFWGQGEQQMPYLVSQCYNQIRLLNKDNPYINKVVLLSLDNLKEYIHIPDYVYQKLHDKSLLYAHFSDIVRNCLLSTYGGGMVGCNSVDVFACAIIAIRMHVFFSP